MVSFARKAGESAFLWSCGDVLAQYVTEKYATDENKKGSNWYNPKRTVQSASFAICVYTPLASTWYGFLAKKFPGKSVQDLFKKVGADQAIFGPTLCSSFFLIMPVFAHVFNSKKGINTDLSSYDSSASVNNWKQHVWTSLKMNWSVWGPVQVFNFALIPPQYWILVCNCVSVPWTAYLAYLNASSGQAGGH